MKRAVLIGDVPVEFRTAITWENAKELPAGTAKAAQPTQGWFYK